MLVGTTRPQKRAPLALPAPAHGKNSCTPPAVKRGRRSRKYFSLVPPALKKRGHHFASMLAPPSLKSGHHSHCRHPPMGMLVHNAVKRDVAHGNACTYTAFIRRGRAGAAARINDIACTTQPALKSGHTARVNACCTARHARAPLALPAPLENACRAARPPSKAGAARINSGCRPPSKAGTALQRTAVSYLVRSFG